MAPPKRRKFPDGRPLTKGQNDFIDALIETGDAVQAVRVAGYKDSQPKRKAWKLTRELAPIIIEAVREQQSRMEPMALKVINDIMVDVKAPDGVRLKAAQDVLDRGDLVRKTITIHQDERSSHEILDDLMVNIGGNTQVLLQMFPNDPVVINYVKLKYPENGEVLRAKQDFATQAQGGDPVPHQLPTVTGAADGHAEPDPPPDPAV